MVRVSSTSFSQKKLALIKYLPGAPPLFHGWSPPAPEPHDSAVSVRDGLQSPLFYPEHTRIKQALMACVSSLMCWIAVQLAARFVCVLTGLPPRSSCGSCWTVTSSNWASSDRGSMSFLPSRSCSSQTHTQTQTLLVGWATFPMSITYRWINL